MPTISSTTIGRFCRELAGGLDTLDVLLTEWDISPEEFVALQRSPGFLTEMQVVQREMQDLGNDAGYIYRMKSLSEQMLPDLVKLLTDVATTPMMKFEMIKWVAEMARLKEKPVPRGEFSAAARGPTVTFKFGAGLPVTSMTITPENYEVPEAPMIDVTPTPSTPVDDSGWPV